MNTHFVLTSASIVRLRNVIFLCARLVDVKLGVYFQHRPKPSELIKKNNAKETIFTFCLGSFCFLVKPIPILVANYVISVHRPKSIATIFFFILFLPAKMLKMLSIRWKFELLWGLGGSPNTHCLRGKWISNRVKYFSRLSVSHELRIYDKILVYSTHLPRVWMSQSPHYVSNVAVNVNCGDILLSLWHFRNGSFLFLFF